MLTLFAVRSLHSEVAIKIIKVDSERQTNEEAFERFNQEVYFQRQLSRHPNIVRFIGSSYEHTPSDDKLMLAIVMERAMLGSLSRMRENVRAVRAWSHACRPSRQRCTQPAQAGICMLRTVYAAS